MDVFIAEFGNVDQFGWCDVGKIRADAGPQFTSEEFKDGCAVRGVHLTLAAPEHQEMNNIAESTWKNIRTIAHSQINFGRVEEKFTHFALINAAHVIMPVLPLKDLVNESGEQTTSIKLMTGNKARIGHIRTLFCPVIVKKLTAQHKGKSLNMRHQPQKGFRGIFVGIPDNQAGYDVYVPAT